MAHACTRLVATSLFFLHSRSHFFEQPNGMSDGSSNRQTPRVPKQPSPGTFRAPGREAGNGRRIDGAQCELVSCPETGKTIMRAMAAIFLGGMAVAAMQANSWSQVHRARPYGCSNHRYAPVKGEDYGKHQGLRCVFRRVRQLLLAICSGESFSFPQRPFSWRASSAWRLSSRIRSRPCRLGQRDRPRIYGACDWRRIP